MNANYIKYKLFMKRFKDAYSILMLNDKRELRMKIMPLDPRIESPYVFFNNYINTKFNWKGRPLISMPKQKINEILDKLQFLDNGDTLTIYKTRCCGMTNFMAAFVAYTVIFEKDIEKKDIWMVSPSGNMSAEVNERVREMFMNLHIETKICNRKLIETTNGWKITFMNANVTNLRGRVMPEYVFMDEFEFIDDKNNEFIDTLLNMNYNMKENGAKIVKYSSYNKTKNKYKNELNLYAHDVLGTMNQVQVKWFHNTRMLKGFRFERYVKDIHNVVRIDENDIEKVINDDEYINYMVHAGWSITSDTLEDYKKMMPADDNDDEFVLKPDTISAHELIERVINKTVSFCDEFGLLEQYEEIYNLFDKSEDIEATDKLLRKIVGPAKKTEKKNLEGCYKFLRDVFEL